jgi:hypothetical protein
MDDVQGCERMCDFVVEKKFTGKLIAFKHTDIQWVGRRFKTYLVRISLPSFVICKR